ncbi:PREDICTED: LOW QUALITY PROTEIN: sushi, von Willebrand factor type A, EGF and pentraxin domain-containing protein 1-like [Branchiostoma belcheri]|uniref:LOW QUALITY PROTEIN: sushi, von Willebrand factor type A, EGF and pentraxin domain-containing protein 1-like n=1 Tax=Branchiostoma belcheri TaxID=7741 RepID=A0A6P4YN43_BRABE|nr:PREDICTED: LOW QUALITY PROTEIN: sushi, von Willebrand factor type A, EGF and pentraxin domain-containing protein 1-like [Branchiostoma belcheri]
MRLHVFLLTVVLFLSLTAVDGWRRRRRRRCPVVNCRWSGWSLGTCSASCGGGTAPCSRTKSPAASCGGADCSGPATSRCACTGPNPCQNGGQRASSGCSCPAGFIGSCCQTRISCPAITAPTNGGNSGCTTYSCGMTFSCNSGYELSGNSAITCQSNGQWSGSRPSCSRVRCPDLSAPSDGTISGSYYYSDVVTFGCSTGFSLQGDATRTCQADKTWSGSQTTCTRKSCPTLTAPANGGIQGTSFLYTDVVSFSCNSGYELSGSSSRTCQADQVWTGSQPTCSRKLCQELSSPANGQVTGGHAYGDVTTFSCDTGYELQGDVRRTCQANQQWSGAQPACSRNACPVLDPPPHGAVQGGHLYGDTATFSCDAGYQLSGTAAVTCQDSQAWSDTPPTCDRKACPAASDPTNGQVSGGRLYGDTVTFSCHPGYELQGSATAVCQADQTWSQDEPSCQLVTCPVLQPPTNGQMTGGNSYGDKVTFTCDPGYELSGSRERSCQANKQWSGAPAVCQKVQCPTLSAPQHGSSTGSAFFGDTLNFGCDTGYELFGSSGITCQADQTWSAAAPSCRKIVCLALPPPLHGQVTGGNEYGDTAVMTCDEGFSLVGDVTRTCQDNKQWSGTQPTCQRKSCPQLSAPDNGAMSGGVLFQDTATFTCDPGYELVGSASRLCQANQQWSGTQPACQKVQCPSLPPLSDGQMTGGSRYGDTVTFSCDDGFLLVGSSERSCQADRQWSGTQPSCQRKQCPQLSSPDHGAVTGGNHYGDVVTFSCDPGYELGGSGSRTCQADQTWSGTEPTCTAISCPGLDAPLNGNKVGGNSYGDTVTFSCTAGYQLTGSSTLTCQHDQQWNGTQPACTRKECPLLPVIDHGVSTGGRLFGDSVTFSCLPGFTLQGNQTRLCRADQTWSGTQPSCRRISCSSLPPPTNGHVTGGVMYEDAVSFTCDEGYELLGSQTAVCQADVTWSSTTPTCQKKSCPVLDVIPDGAVTGGHLYGDTATFTCSAGYQLVGDQYRTCQANQTWTGLQPFCQKKCCNALTVENGVVTGHTCFNNTVSVSCDVGYSIVGDSKLTCTEDGVWDKPAPTCKKICCDETLTIANGSVVQTGDGGLCFGNIVTFSCNTGHQLVGGAAATCQEDGTWSALPVCERVCCSEVGVIRNGQSTTTESCYNDVATFSCAPGFRLVSRGDVVCGADGTWRGDVPFCEPDNLCSKDVLANPNDGYKVCYSAATGGEDKEFCTMHCNPPKSYGLGRVVTYQCGDHTSWLWMTRVSNLLKLVSVSACQDPWNPFAMIMIGGLTITSTTSPNLHQIRHYIRTELLRQGLCLPPCRISDISVDAGVRTRRRRDISPLTVIDITIQLYIEDNSQLSLQTNTLPADVDALIRKSALDIKTALTSGTFHVPINGENLTIADTGAALSDPVIGCPVGFLEKVTDSGCFACPPGSFHTPCPKTVSPCPVGTYQTNSSQTSCQSCPEGTTTSAEGTSDPSQCKEYSDCNCGPNACVPTSQGWMCQCPTGHIQQDDKCVAIIECPLGSRLFRDTCYLVSNTTATYRAAGETCRQHGGLLAMVKDKDTQDFIMENYSGKDMWIGLDDRLTEGEFLWADGSSLDSFTYWTYGEPNDGGARIRSQDCVHLWLAAQQRWDDTSCKSKRFYLCQIGKQT